jgi:hypothetical protein
MIRCRIAASRVKRQNSCLKSEQLPKHVAEESGLCNQPPVEAGLLLERVKLAVMDRLYRLSKVLYDSRRLDTVIPAETGIQVSQSRWTRDWPRAFGGMAGDE